MGIELLLGVMSVTSLFTSIYSIGRKYFRERRRQRERIDFLGRTQVLLRQALADDDFSLDERDQLLVESAEYKSLLMSTRRLRNSLPLMDLNPVDEKSIAAFVDELERVETLSRGNSGSAATVG